MLTVSPLPEHEHLCDTTRIHALGCVWPVADGASTFTSTSATERRVHTSPPFAAPGMSLLPHDPHPQLLHPNAVWNDVFSFAWGVCA